MKIAVMLFGSRVLECAVEKEVLLEILQNSQSPKTQHLYENPNAVQEFEKN